jgi:nucleoside-diphosphate-sugar epimerase
MVAYDSLLKAAQSDGLKILVYIAPIRQGLPLPYDKAEYANWKAAVEKVAHLYGAKFVNFEKLVPPVVWGEYDRQDVDFMHFQGEGHKILAKAIYSQLEK